VPEAARLRRWQAVTVATLFAGYAGCYACRSVLPVASNGMMNDPASGIDEVGYGRLVAVGVYLSAAGKLVTGVGAEYVSGRAAFLVAMVFSAALVAGFGVAGGAAAMLVLWGANRFVQSAGWVAVVKVTGRWFAPARLATVMGALAISYLFGDFLARLYLGAFVSAGAGWRELFLIAAGTLGALAVGGFFTLKSSPADVGLPEPPPPARNVFGAADRGHGRVSLWKLLGPLFASRMFWLVCLMNVGLTAIRETFNAWTPRYLEKGVGLSASDVGMLSAVFPLCGAAASLGAGWAADRLRGRFGRLIVPLAALTAVVLWALAEIDLRGKPVLALALISAAALFVMGPYTFCSGVLALNLGGKRGSAASAGIIDAAGYACGAVVAGDVVAGQLVKHRGFGPLLDVLFWVGVATCAAGAAYWYFEERLLKSLDASRPPPGAEEVT
jgi:OPA family glycerol-3-phosphate transporter-like MFS transporter